jgi:hypothetical protein
MWEACRRSGIDNGKAWAMRIMMEHAVPQERKRVKMAQRGRDGKLGMVKPTLENPDVIIEDYRPASDGKSERDTSYVFIKTFVNDDGSSYYHFTSVTVRKEGHEVVISNQERSSNRKYPSYFNMGK